MVVLPPRQGSSVIINLVYNDTILPLKDMGDNLKVSSISNVSESEFENCLQLIFKSNPNVDFNTVQYSKNKKKVYFYTNQDIKTTAYEETKFKSVKPITSRTEILEEVKKILLSPKNKDNNCISLYDVLKLLKKLENEYESIIKGNDYLLTGMTRNKISMYSMVRIQGLNFVDKTLRISFSPNYMLLDDWKNIDFAKKNGDLYVVKSESIYTDKVFSVLCSTLSGIYDELLKYKDYKSFKYSTNDIKAVNSNFNISINSHGVSLHARGLFIDQFELFAPSTPSYKDGYELKCNSSIINEVFNGKETEIFKRIFVEIGFFPEWSQAMLREIRQNQLKEEQKKQKKLELIKRFFPFLNK